MRGAATTKKAIQQWTRRIAETYRPQRIVLFGSYAYGTPHHDSDVDLLIIKSTEESPLQRRVAVRRLIRDPKRTIPIGLLVVTPDELQERLAIGDQFFKEILERGEVLHGG